MKKYKKIISSIMALVITILPLSISTSGDSYAEYVTDGFHYTTNR